jgi:hypothetical protein
VWDLAHAAFGQRILPRNTSASTRITPPETRLLTTHRKQCRLLKLPSIQVLREIEDGKYTGFFTQL